MPCTGRLHGLGCMAFACAQRRSPSHACRAPSCAAAFYRYKMPKLVAKVGLRMKGEVVPRRVPVPPQRSDTQQAQQPQRVVQAHSPANSQLPRLHGLQATATMCPCMQIHARLSLACFPD